MRMSRAVGAVTLAKVFQIVGAVQAETDVTEIAEAEPLQPSALADGDSDLVVHSNELFRELLRHDDIRDLTGSGEAIVVLPTNAALATATAGVAEADDEGQQLSLRLVELLHAHVLLRPVDADCREYRTIDSKVVEVRDKSLRTVAGFQENGLSVDIIGRDQYFDENCKRCVHCFRSVASHTFA